MSGRAAADGTFERRALACGATLLVKRRPGHPSVAFGVSARAGSALETEAMSGTNALTHRAMTKGTATRTSARIAHEAELHGASAAPAIGVDVSGFSIRTVSRSFDPALEVLADIVRAPSFPADEVERERRLLLAEIAQEEDEPFPLASRALRRALFGADSYALPVEGTAEGVRARRCDELAAWHRRFYRADGLLAVCAGDVDADRVAARVDAALAGAPRGAEPAVPPPPPRALGAPRLDRAERAEIVIEKPVHQDVILVGFLGPSAASPDDYALHLLAGVMSGMGNRLFVALRDREGLCYYTGMFYQAYARAGMLGLYIGTSPDKEERARAGLAREIRRLLDGGVATDELERARRAMIGHSAIGRQTNAAEAGLAARWELLGVGFEEMDRFEERLLAVSADDVARAARRWIDPDRAAAVIVRPKR